MFGVQELEKGPVSSQLRTRLPACSEICSRSFITGKIMIVWAIKCFVPLAARIGHN